MYMHCSRWDYGYALLKEAGIYDSAGKPVKQREVRRANFPAGDFKFEKCQKYPAWCGWPGPESWAEVHCQGGAGRKEGADIISKADLMMHDFQDNPFGSLPKFLGIKLSENYTAADSRAQGAFQVCKIKRQFEKI